MRNLILTDEMFNLYDKIVESITLIEIDENDFDGIVFSYVMTDFGFGDIF